MKSIANQYKDLKEGKMSQANFMRNLRMSMPQVTNTMSFGDAVKVLKNKGIITESFDITEKENDEYSIPEVAIEEPNEDAEFDAMLKQIEDEMAGEEAVKGQYDLEEGPEEEVEKAIQAKKIDPAVVKTAAEKAMRGDSTDLALLMVNAGNLNEAKETTNPNKVHPQEYTMGIKYELKCFKGDVVKAERAVLKNLAKEPFYYTALKLAGKDIHKEAPAVKAEVPKKKSKKKEVELVDTINAMQKVKMPKKDEKKKLKENQLNEGGEYTFIGRLNSAELKKIHEIIPDIEIDVEQDDDMERTTVTSKFYNNKFIEQAVDGVINPPKSTMRPGVDMGKSFEKFKSKLAEMVKKAMAEMYDGRDNLTNISDDTK
jgi:hypothetical protein